MKNFVRNTRTIGKMPVFAACLLVLAGQCAAIEAQIDLKLAIPECKIVMSPGERTELPRHQVSRFVLQVRPKVGAVRYGSIRVMLNGESMNRDMSINGVEGGYDCVIESGTGTSLPLRDGENVVEVSLTDTWNHPHNANFAIVVPAKPAN